MENEWQGNGGEQVSVLYLKFWHICFEEFDFWLSFELVDIRVSAFAILFKFSKLKLYFFIKSL
jgi:hypothetical protein